MIPTGLDGLDRNSKDRVQLLLDKTRTTAMLDTLESILAQTPKGKAIKKNKIALTIKELKFKLAVLNDELTKEMPF